MRLIDADKLRYDAELCRETTDAFQELIDEQPTVCGGWIPVSQLPEDESDVLLYGEGKGIVIAYYSDGVWYDHQHNHLRDRTHWVPLPAPPKEDV